MDNKPDCAMCGEPYNRHNGLFCPVYATYRPKPPEAADEITRLNALVDELVEGLELAVPHLSGPPYAHRDDIGAVRIKLRCLITKASRTSGHG